MSTETSSVPVRSIVTANPRRRRSRGTSTRLVTSATVISQHVQKRISELSYAAQKETYGFDNPELRRIEAAKKILFNRENRLEKTLRDAARTFNKKVKAAEDRFLDQIVMHGAPNLAQTLREFKAKLAAIR